MGTAVRYPAFSDQVGKSAASANAKPAGKLSILRGIADRIERHRARLVDREISDLLAGSGGRFTDSFERQIDRKVLFGPR